MLHSFAPNSFRSSSRLVQAANRDLYGTSFTHTDGTGGTAFRITLGGTFTTVHTFRGNSQPFHNGDPADGYAPGELIRGPDGNLYGTSSAGGAFRMGTAFRITPDGAVTLLHSFSQDAAGFDPCSPLLLASDGSLYGRSCRGGGSDRGTLFKLTLSGVVTVVHDFAVTEGRGNGYSLTQGSDGFLYGGTETVIFRTTTDGAFSALNTLAANSLPRGALVQGTDGRFYGTTLYGGDFRRGQVLSLDAAGTVRTLHAFRPGPDGSSPSGTLVEGPDGALYGTTELGGAYDRGVAFRLAPDGTYSILHTFVGGSADGEGPFGLILGSDGSLYGSTARGGISDDGTIFRMTPGGEVTILHHFAGAPSDGAYGAFLATAADGSFYGVTQGGGAFDGGTAFRMTPSGAVTILHHFAGGMSDGAYPGAALVQAGGGNFYGTTSYGGVRGYGTIFRMTADGEVTVLHSLYAFDGDYSPLGVPGLRLGADGNLYGTVTSNIKGGARGSEVFRVTLDGRYTVLHAFDHAVEGFPGGALELASDGNLYGWSRSFVAGGRFEIFRITPTGVYTPVYTDATGTGHPRGRLIQASDGHLYGVRGGGGARVDAWGTLFRVRGVECPYSHTASPSQLVASGNGGAHVITVNTRPGCSWTPASTVPWLTVLDSATRTGSGTFTVVVAPRRGSGTRAGFLTGGAATLAMTVTQSGGTGRPFDIVRWDLDGDRRTDVAAWQSVHGLWFTLHSATPGEWSSRTWGIGGGAPDRPVPGDYDGDGRGDFAVWRPGYFVGGTFEYHSFWHILTSRSGYTASMSIQWGTAGLNDVPVPADYDGDGATDVAVWRPRTGTWFVKTSSSGFRQSFTVHWGGESADLPVAGDWDGDGRADLGIYRRTAGTWYILLSHTNYSLSHAFIRQWGGGAIRADDEPLVGDYDGDGMSDLTIWRAAAGRWYLLLSSANFLYAHAREVFLGEASVNDVPLAGDYDGDGRTDLVLWRHSTGRWFIRRSSTDYADAVTTYWGHGTFPWEVVPVPWPIPRY